MRGGVLLLGTALLAGCGAPPPQPPADVAPPVMPAEVLPEVEEHLLHEETSAYSRIRVTERHGMRRLYFVRDDGVEVLQSAIDPDAPHRLQVPYTRVMFAALLLREDQRRCLLVGLGGGAMVHFLRHHLPEARLDAVEIDPAVVRIAARYFDTLPGPRSRIVTADGFDFLARCRERYDAIYMDAFLKPGEDTDATGVPLRLKTVAFFRDLQERLRPGGVVAFNLNLGPDTEEDVDALRAAFPQLYLFPVHGRANLVAVGSTEPRRRNYAELQETARRLDARFADTGFSFTAIASCLERPLR